MKKKIARSLEDAKPISHRPHHALGFAGDESAGPSVSGSHALGFAGDESAGPAVKAPS